MPFDSIEAKAVILGNSKPFDVHRWSDYPEVNSAVDIIYAELRESPEFSGNEKLRKQHVKVVILDLYACWLSDPEQYIAYSRNRADYRANSRYNELHISQLTIPIVDALLARRFVEHHLGYFDKEAGAGKFSRMRATARLIQLIAEDHRIPREAIGRHPDAECIILRDKVDGEKANVEYDDAPETNQMREVLRAYNGLLAQTSITLPGIPEDGIPTSNQTRRIKPDFTDKFVRRIFSNGSWDQGGRFHGGWWQRIPGDWRTRISIDGSENGSVEIDYKGLHICLLYALVGIDYWAADGQDPYSLDGYERSKRMRNFLKKVLLTIINAAGRRSALGAIRKDVNDHPDEFGWLAEESLSMGAVIDAFVERHAPIAGFFYSGVGIKLQRIESDIAERVIEQFTARSCPLLCVHDSFVVRPEEAECLHMAMDREYRREVFELSGGKLEFSPELSVKHVTG
jgi:hypothetical protein